MKKGYREKIAKKKNADSKEKRKSVNTEQIEKTMLLTVGIWGVLLILHGLPGTTFPLAAACLVTALLCASMSFLYGSRKRWFRVETSGMLALCIASAFIQREQLAGQAVRLYESLAGSASGEVGITGLVFVSVCGMTVFFFILENRWKVHWLPYLVITAFLVCVPVFGIRIGFGAVCFCLIFQILFWVIQKNNLASAASAIFFVGGLLILVTCAAILITFIWGQDLSNSIYRGEGFISRSVERMTGNSQETESNGLVNTGNNYQTGDTQLEVTLWQEPTETLYLKGFTGGNYGDGQWMPADDQRDFHETAVVLGWENWESWISDVCFRMYFYMNGLTAREPVEPRVIYLSHTSGTDKGIYVPYFTEWPNRRGDIGSGYGFQYYEESEMHIDWDNIPEASRMSAGWYRMIRDAYMDTIADTCTGVPRESLPRLAALCEDNPMASEEEVTAFISAVLESGASYTLTPGRAPLNEDIVEYFLFEDHEGYCVHYASAATLMYRLYGIPARYVSGYAVAPSDFTEQEDGTWTAQVSDRSAHAWTEIFLEDYGWTPVEVTPDTSGRITASYPGLDAEEIGEILEEWDLNDRLLETPDTEQISRAPEQEREGDSFGEIFSIRLPDRLHPVWILLLCAGFIVLFLHVRRRRCLKELEHMGVRKIFAKWMDMMDFCGFLSGYSGLEEDFPKKAAEAIPEVSRQQFRKMAEIVSREAYGPSQEDENSRRFVMEVYQKSAADLEGHLKGIRKLRFRYLRCYR